jgi:Sulfotransferase family
VNKADSQDYKYVFVCGMPRSGTSILGRNIARMENCTGLHNTGVIEDEGRFLQDVYPAEGECGGPGRFGFDPRAHLTETSPLLTPENILKLRRSWEPYWDQNKMIRVEKTPANLLMTRFLQAAFPNAYFVVIRRHPVPVSLAIQKWKVNLTSLHSLFEHWLHCHKLFDEDKKYLKHVYELRYKDYIENPAKYHNEIALFIGTRVAPQPKQDGFRYVVQWGNATGLHVPESAMEELSGVHNQKYFNRWSDLLTNSFFNRYFRYITLKYEPEFEKYGYTLTEGFELNEARRIFAVVGTLYCLAADVCALTVRSVVQSKWYVKRQIRAHFPERLRARIKCLIQKIGVLFALPYGFKLD